MTRRSGGTSRVVLALVGLAAVVVLALTGCSSDGTATSVPGDGATAAPGHGPQGFAAVTVVVTAPDGSVTEWCVWLADTPHLRAQGLMGVTDPSLGGAPAMVFAFPADTAAGFWMKDTELPLSIAFYAADGTYLSAADMDPCPPGVDECPVTSPGARYRYAVEVAQGSLERLGMVAGSTISLGPACSPEAVAA